MQKEVVTIRIELFGMFASDIESKGAKLTMIVRISGAGVE